jgi:hypothetical protein
MRILRNIINHLSQAWERNQMLSLKLIDYNRFQRLHLENLLMDFKRLGLNQPDFKINPQDKVGDGFL